MLLTHHGLLYKNNSLMIQFYIKDTHGGGGVLHLKHNCKEFEEFEIF